MALKIGKGASAPPFLVMDVISAANARQAALPPVRRMSSAWRSASPAPVRPPARSPPPRPPCGPAIRWATPRHSVCARCAIGSPPMPADWYGLDLPIERIAVTVGASGAFPLAFLAAFDPGDRIAMAAPFYPALRQHPDRARA